MGRGGPTMLTIRSSCGSSARFTGGKRRSWPAEEAEFSTISAARFGWVGYNVPMQVRGAPPRMVLMKTPLRRRRNAGTDAGGSMTRRLMAYVSKARRASARTYRCGWVREAPVARRSR